VSPAAAASAPHLRLVEALLADSRADEAEMVLRRVPASAAPDAAALATLAALLAAQGRLEESAGHAA